MHRGDNMGSIFNFSNPILSFLNIFIIITFLAILYVGYRLSAILEFYKECENANLCKEDKKAQAKDDFEPFFEGYGDFTKEKFVGDIFNEYSKYYEQENKKKSQVKEVVKTRSDSFPKCYKTLGFTEKPKSKDEIKAKYRDLAKRLHPDLGGSQDFFIQLGDAYREALKVWDSENDKL